MRPHPSRYPPPAPWTHSGPTSRGHALAHEIHAVMSAGEELLRTKADLLLTRVATIIAEPPSGCALTVPDPATQRLSQAVVLIYELLDAHDDTARLAGELAPDPDWQAHLDYLRALQRAGRELLAHITTRADDQ